MGIDVVEEKNMIMMIPAQNSLLFILEKWIFLY